jgi:hypothetical protein
MVTSVECAKLRNGDEVETADGRLRFVRHRNSEATFVHMGDNVRRDFPTVNGIVTFSVSPDAPRGAEKPAVVMAEMPTPEEPHH